MFAPTSPTETAKFLKLYDEEVAAFKTSKAPKTISKVVQQRKSRRSRTKKTVQAAGRGGRRRAR